MRASSVVVSSRMPWEELLRAFLPAGVRMARAMGRDGRQKEGGARCLLTLTSLAGGSGVGSAEARAAGNAL